MNPQTVTEASFERYLDASGLPHDTKQTLRTEFKAANDKKAVYDKAVGMAGRRQMTKVPRFSHK